MAVKIRLMRMGKKKQPTYRVVVADGRSPRDGRYIEIIGQYGPRQEPSQLQIDDERALAWLRQGAQPTEQVQKLLVTTGVWERFRAEHPKAAGRHKPRTHTPKPKAAAAAPPAEAPAADAGDAATEAEGSES